MKDCESCVHEYLSPMSDTCRECGIAMLNYEERKPTTHFDWIKSLSVEKLANVLTDDFCEILCGSPSVCDGKCEGKMLSWLKTPLNKEGG